ncbi:LysR family transcriptional regulator [Kiloniella sp. b19]|uniref:LysR family transcriptional regulator n=1 Tax=Kiloniella sp. GXU_MW_B19 TaxID=3141326 RepID=UPI0031D85236
MQIDWVITFLDLCETQSFNRTAENIGITQSTVSSRIQALEKVLGVKLFQRNRSGTELTIHGLKFEAHARRLQRNWFEALRVTQVNPSVVTTLKIGLQHDLATSQIGDWVQEFRELFPDSTLYIEGDYSEQMCRDLIHGLLDLAIIFTPKPHPDLHFESLGEITCRMVSTETDNFDEIRQESYIFSNLSPAFAATHEVHHPELSRANISSGKNVLVAGLLHSMGGTAYLLDDMAQKMIESGQCREVRRAPLIQQSVYGAVHLRNRHRTAHRRLMKLLQNHFSTEGYDPSIEL